MHAFFLEMHSSDGQTVNIPSPRHFSMEGRSLVVRASYWIDVLVLRVFAWEIRQTSTQELRRDFPTGFSIRVSKLPRKVSKIRSVESVPKTDTGRQVE